VPTLIFIFYLSFLFAAVELGHPLSEYPRNAAALSEMEHQAAERFEPEGRVFGCRAMSARAAIAGDSERRDAPSIAVSSSIIQPEKLTSRRHNIL
jgi:hypothetical protein